MVIHLPQPRINISNTPLTHLLKIRQIFLLTNCSLYTLNVLRLQKIVLIRIATVKDALTMSMSSIFPFTNAMKLIHNYFLLQVKIYKNLWTQTSNICGVLMICQKYQFSETSLKTTLRRFKCK